MATGKKSIVVYSDWMKKFEVLTDDEAGKLIKHFFRYVNDLNPVAPDRITELSFIDIEQSLKRDLVKWELRAERSRENGKSGGRPHKDINPEKPRKTQQVILKPRKPDSVSVNVSVNDILLEKETKVNTTSQIVKWDMLLSQFNEITGKSTKVINDKVKHQILARLREGYSKQDILDAMTNCFNDDYHKETNHKFLTLEFISRSDKMEKYSTMKAKKQEQKIKV